MNARGTALIHGLGLGMVLDAFARRTTVDHVWCVEKSADVIALVGDHYRRRWGDRITIVHADALTWQPPKGTRFGSVWHDIWPDICADNIEEMKRLTRRYARRCEWQGSWARSLCEMARG